MKCFLTLLVFLVVVLVCIDGKKKADKKPKLKEVTKLGKGGKHCKSGTKLICHLDMKLKLSSTLSKVCNNGKLENMKIPRGYQSPRGKLKQCLHKGKKFCHGDKITNFRSWTLEHKCDDGNIFYRNLLTGLRFSDKQLLNK